MNRLVRISLLKKFVIGRPTSCPRIILAILKKANFRKVEETLVFMPEKLVLVCVQHLLHAFVEGMQNHLLNFDSVWR